MLIGRMALRPMQIFLQMIGACSIVDVVVGLKNREFGQVWVDLDADRREEYPRSFTKVNMIYHVEGDVPEKLVRRTIEKSHEKYCSVSNSLDEKHRDRLGSRSSSEVSAGFKD